MPIFVVRQVVTHPLLKTARIKESHIIGRDLGHAVDCVRVPEPMKRDLRKKYWAETIDPYGRKLSIEIIEEKKK